MEDKPTNFNSILLDPESSFSFKSSQQNLLFDSTEGKRMIYSNKNLISISSNLSYQNCNIEDIDLANFFKGLTELNKSYETNSVMDLEENDYDFYLNNYVDDSTDDSSYVIEDPINFEEFVIEGSIAVSPFED